MKESAFKKPLLIIIGISALVRAFLAASLELGNDEVYYWSYAMYPDLSHFDHPPMIGWLIQLFTVNLNLNSELFIRLCSIVIGSANTWIIYIIGRRIKDEAAGFYASILYTTSIYCSIILGTFILPDTPQSIFFLLSIYFLHEALFKKYGECPESRALCNFAIILAGLFIGMAMLSKYSAAFLWVGAGLYILFFDRKRLKDPFLYLAIIVSALFLLPILIWNLNNNFISFTFHGNRVSFFGEGFNIVSFGREIIGNFLYNNPVNVVIIISALIAYSKVKFLEKRQFMLLALVSFPIILCFLFFSMFRDTLPHWSAPGYYGLMIIAGAWLSEKYKSRNIGTSIPAPLKRAIWLITVVVTVGFIHIHTGILNFEVKQKSDLPLGKYDFTLDMYGWETLFKEFNKVREYDVNHGIMNRHSAIVSYKWFPAAHLDYYVARPAKSVVKTIGPLSDTHKYAWITKDIGGFKIGESVYYLRSSKERFDGVKEIGERYFKSTELAKTVYIFRMGKPAERYEIFRFREMTTLPDSTLTSPSF